MHCIIIINKENIRKPFSFVYFFFEMFNLCKRSKLVFHLMKFEITFLFGSKKIRRKNFDWWNLTIYKCQFIHKNVPHSGRKFATFSQKYTALMQVHGRETYMQYSWNIERFEQTSNTALKTFFGGFIEFCR